MAVELSNRLRRIFPSERILEDRVSLLVYECDGYSMHRMAPSVVVFPLTTEEVQGAVLLANELGVPFLARGSGTGLSGAATPGRESCLLIELAAMKRILRLEPEDRIAVVQPGLVNLDLSEAASAHGLCYAPDPSSQAACTLGGNLAQNSGGPHCFKYGMTTDHVLGVEMVLGDGERVELREGDGPDLVGLITGSEGTFGIVTELTLRLSPAPCMVRTWLASFSSMAGACRAVSAIVRSGVVPAALEILDRLTIQAVEASTYAAGYPRNAAAVLLVELDGSESMLLADGPEVERLLLEGNPLQLESTADSEQRARLWRGRKGAFGAMGRLRPDLYVLDGVVPRSRLEPVLNRILEIGERHGVMLANVLHAGDGNLHPNLSFDARDEAERCKVLAAGREILELCVQEGGSITGEHGIGSEKMEYVSFMFSPTDLEVFGELRASFDPNGLCNPGKVCPSGGSCSEGRSARLPEALGD